MQKIFMLLLVVVTLLTLAACGKAIENNTPPNVTNDTIQIETTPVSVNVTENNSSVTDEPVQTKGEKSMTSITITIGNSVFLAKLYDNEAAKAFLTQFPMTLNMSDLNSNEKYYYLDENLPSALTEKPATMNTGDIMCWSGNCLVLFYKTFSNPYGGYVPLGYTTDASSLATALGNGTVNVSFAISE